MAEAEWEGQARIVERGSDPEAVGSLIAFFEQIALQEGWQPGEQLRAHRDTSVYFGVLDESGNEGDGWNGSEWAAGMQVVLADGQGRFAFQAVWPEVIMDAPQHTAHVAVLAVRPDLRGHSRLFWPLCVQLWRFCIERQIETLILEATPSMQARYTRLGWPLCQIGAERLHWGEPCVLSALSVQAVGGAMLARAVRSPAFRTLIGQAMQPLPDSVRRTQTPVDCTAAVLVAS